MHLKYISLPQGLQRKNRLEEEGLCRFQIEMHKSNNQHSSNRLLVEGQEKLSIMDVDGQLLALRYFVSPLLSPLFCICNGSRIGLKPISN